MTESQRHCLPARYVFTVFVSAGLAIIYGLKVNLSVTIVAMVNNTALAAMADDGHVTETDSNDSVWTTKVTCPVLSANGTTPSPEEDGPFVWSEPVKGLVLGAYFWGYILTQIPGGRVAELFSAKWVIWSAVTINVVFTILSPLASRWSYVAVLIVRFVEGLGAGMSLPAVQVMVAKWAPPGERNKLSSLIYAGMPLGTVMALPFSGFLAGSFGWESVFYAQGGLAVLWCVFWPIFVFDSPQEHPFIGRNELQLFADRIVRVGENRPRSPVPWKAIATSGPFWAILISHCCKNFGWYILLVELPTYMAHVLNFSIRQNALLSALPYLSLWVFSVVWSNLMDMATNRHWISVTTVRKLSTALSSLLPAACFVGVSLVGCDRNAAVVLMTLGTMFMACMYCGIVTNHIDIASNYAGTLMALTNTCATVPGFIVPLFVGYLTHGNQQGLDRWQIIFFTTAGVLVLECVVYTVLGSAEEQPWNRACVSVGQHSSPDRGHTDDRSGKEKLQDKSSTV